MPRHITVAAGQLGPNADDPSEVIDRMIAMLEQAKGVDVICFPEWSISPFAFCGQVILGPHEQYFERLPNERTKPLFEKAKALKMALIVPYAERDGTHFYNSAIVVDEEGEVLGHYRKNHIPLQIYDHSGRGNYEKVYFEPGNLGFPVFTLCTAQAKIGVQICYDRRFPEGSRILALKGAEIIFYPTNLATYGQAERPGSWGPELQCRALENQVFVVAPNKSGEERGRLSVGRSMIISPVGGQILAEAGNDGDELVTATIDLDDIARVRANLPLTRDMRPDLYRELFELYGLEPSR